MKIEFDKALLLLILYLYLISLCYYWGYWVTLDIDAFNYYAVSDIIKSIVSPITTPLSNIVVLALMYIGTEFIDEKTRGKSNKVILIATLSFFALTVLFLFLWSSYFSESHPNVDYGKGGYYMNLVIIGLCLYLSTRVALKVTLLVINDSNKHHGKFIYVIFYLMILMLGHTFREGKNTALRILQNKEFQYVIGGTDVLAKGEYKYLGKIGDYYALMTVDNNKRIVIPIDKLVPLTIEKFSLIDDTSVRRFKTYQKERTTLAKTAPPKQPDSTRQQPTQPK